MSLSSRAITGGSPTKVISGWAGGGVPSTSQACRWCRAASTTGATETWFTACIASPSSGMANPKSRSMRGDDEAMPGRDTCEAPATSQYRKRSVSGWRTG